MIWFDFILFWRVHDLIWFHLKNIRSPSRNSVSRILDHNRKDGPRHDAGSIGFCKIRLKTTLKPPDSKVIVVFDLDLIFRSDQNQIKFRSDHDLSWSDLIWMDFCEVMIWSDLILISKLISDQIRSDHDLCPPLILAFEHDLSCTGQRLKRWLTTSVRQDRDGQCRTRCVRRTIPKTPLQITLKAKLHSKH